MGKESPEEKRADAEEIEKTLDNIGAGDMIRHPGRPAADQTPSPASDADVQAPG
ncbi:MAG: hypothetical protein JWR83_1766 [Aeromicrobium sp.]|nr:hypothetical protein [Aeromicrobium sp.]